MAKDNYQATARQYQMDGNVAVRISTGERLSVGESRGIRRMADWRYRASDGLPHEYSDTDCALLKKPYKLKCTAGCQDVIQPDTEHVQSFEYNKSDDVVLGQGRIVKHEIVCESCWNILTGKRISQQRFREEGPGW